MYRLIVKQPFSSHIFFMVILLWFLNEGTAAWGLRYDRTVIPNHFCKHCHHLSCFRCVVVLILNWMSNHYFWSTPHTVHLWLRIVVVGYYDFYNSWNFKWCRQNIMRPIFLSKDCEHSVVQLTRPVKLRRKPLRTRQSLRASIIYKGPAQFVTQQPVEALPSTTNQVTPTATTHETVAGERGSTVNRALPHTDDDREQGKALTHLFLFITSGISRLN